MMSRDESGWLSLSSASKLLGVHYTTLRRWADAGSIPCFRTPGGHRRFRAEDLTAWLEGKRTVALAPHAEDLVHTVVRRTRREMAVKRVVRESWSLAFEQEDERQRMRDTGRELFRLAIQYVSRTSGQEPVLQEGQQVGEFYGRQCAQRGITLVDTMRACFFFRQSLLDAMRPTQARSSQFDFEHVRIHQQLCSFLDEVMYACLEGYEQTCQHLLLRGERE
jgi:excisionase family DNA binding protein